MAANAGEIRARLVLNNTEFKKKMGEAREDMKKTGFSAKQMKEDFGQIQKASLGLGAAVLAGIGGSTKIAMDFEQQMSRVKAIAQANEAEYKSLQDAALDLGAATSKSASEVALGMEDMAALGFEVNEILAAMPGVISASEASGAALADTANIVASALNAFHLEAAEATRVADILAMTANVSAADVTDMGHALKYVGPVANSLGISLEEVSAAIGIMTNNGLAGSQAGTSLRAALLALNNPAKAQAKIMEQIGFSMRDSSGEAKSLSDMVKDLTTATENMTEAERVATIGKLVGTEAASGMIAVIDGGVDQLDDFTKSLQNSAGASKEAADVMMDNLAGAWEEFTGALETVGIKLGNEFLPVLKEIVTWGAEIVSQFDDVEISQIKSALAFGGTTAAIALTLSTIGKLTLAVRGLLTSMGPAGWLIMGVSLLGGALVGAAVSTEDLQDKIGRLNQEFNDLNSLDEKVKEFENLQYSSRLTNDEFARYIDLQSELQKTSNPEVIAAIKDEMAALEEKSGFQNGELDKMVGLNADLIELMPEATDKITDQGNAIIESTDALKNYSREKLQTLYTDLELTRLATEVEYKETLEAEADLINDQQKALQKLNDLQGERVTLQQRVTDEETVLEEMLANKELYHETEIQNQRLIVKEAERLLGINEQNIADQAKKIQNNEIDLEQKREEIKAFEDVRFQMVDILLKQEGLTAERGKGLLVVQGELETLRKEREQMEKNTGEAQKNTEEYRQAKAAIDAKIERLEAVEGQIIDITQSTYSMNEQMARSINKPVYVTWNGATAPPHLRDPVRLQAHSGGYARDAKPKLHSGGTPESAVSSLKNIPLHNEIDVRLLRNELVLTEGQQSNLWRVLQSGVFDGQGNNEHWTQIIRLLEDVAQGVHEGKDLQIIMNDREVGRILEPHVTEIQGRTRSRNKTF